MPAEKLFMKAFKYRIAESTAADAGFLQYMADAFGQTRFVWNQLKDHIDGLLRQKRHLPSRIDLNNYVNRVLKKQYPWLSGSVDKFYFTHTVCEIHAACQAYIKGDRGEPHFRRRHSPVQTVTTSFTNDNIRADFEQGTVSLPYLNKERRLKVILHRPLEGRIMGAQLTRHCTGDYYVIILCEVPEKPLPPGEKAVGVDVGLKDPVTCSDGTVYPALKAFYKMERRIKRKQRSLSRKYEAAGKKCKEGEKVQVSKNYLKVRESLARDHERVRNMRSDAADKISLAIISENQVIAAEDLNTQGMMKNHKLAKAVADAVFRKLLYKLEYKAAWYGRTFIKVDRYFPSTQLCPHCGYQNKELRGLKGLSIREWECPDCHAKNSRDFAAAVNILNEGLRLLQQEGGDLRPRDGDIPMFKPVETPAGESMKQEAHKL